MSAKAKKPAKKTPKDNHENCVKLLNEQLAPRNLEVPTVMTFDFEKGTGGVAQPLKVFLVKKSTGKPVDSPLHCSFCPLCGKQLY